MKDFIAEAFNPDILWPYAFFTFFVVCLLVFISTCLKTKWWRTSMGVNVFLLSGWFVFVMVLGVLGILGVLPEWLRAWSRFIVYSSGSFILIWRVWAMWYWNKGFWAWSKTGRNKDG